MRWPTRHPRAALGFSRTAPTALQILGRFALAGISTAFETVQYPSRHKANFSFPRCEAVGFSPPAKVPYGPPIGPPCVRVPDVGREEL